jgi:hypothetical protein
MTCLGIPYKVQHGSVLRNDSTGTRATVKRVLRTAVLVALAGCGSDRAGNDAWASLQRTGTGATFDPATLDAATADRAATDPAILEELPPPARRFLLWAIQPGTPLAESVELGMRGEIYLDSDSDPLLLQAEQILSPPEGFIWRADAGRGVMRISGYDRYHGGEGEMRWAFWGLIPVIREGGIDVTRSAAGRMAMEAVLLPSVLLPGGAATWEAVDDGAARFRMRVGDEEVVTTLDVDPDGRPIRASADRWSAEAGPGFDRFVVEFSGTFESGGYRIPARVSAGWRLGEEDEFRFFEAEMERAVFR